jgi:LmbE family N-acetylglucosaminyl deacetylase
MAGRARPRLRVLHRRLLVAEARDITDSTSRQSALVLAPHPDDETIGCGGTIARKVAAGAAVRVLIAADGHDEQRRHECREACAILGLSEQQLTFLGFPDGGLSTHANDLTGAVRSAVASFQPDQIFVPSGVDAHPDHQALATAVDRVRADTLRDTSVLAYPIWFWNRWAWVDRSTSPHLQKAQLAWRPVAFTARTRTVVVRTDGFVETKRRALAAHRSQVIGSRDDPERRVLDPTWLEMFLGSEELFFVVQRPAMI